MEEAGITEGGGEIWQQFIPRDENDPFTELGKSKEEKV